MAKSRKVWHILVVNRSQNVVFYSPIYYSSRGGGAFLAEGGALQRGCIFATVRVSNYKFMLLK